MQLRFSSQGEIEVLAHSLSLHGGRPVLNGAPLEGLQAEVLERQDDRLLVRFRGTTLGDATFSLEAWRLPEGGWGLRYYLEGLELDLALDSFGLHFSAVENLRAYLRNGYTSWDGSYYAEPEGLADFEAGEARPESGYAMTQLLPRLGEINLVLGFERHDRFQHTFKFNTRQTPPALTILSLWDRKERSTLERVESETLTLLENTQVEEGLRAWAQRVAAASPTPPRQLSTPITGWCSWYNLYPYITGENIRQHLEGARSGVERFGLPMRVFQIDDGFTPEMGDWLEVKPQFPGGVAPLLDEIRAAGFLPGLWIAPFLVGNRSRLYQEYPDWVVHERASGGPLVHWRLYSENRWHKRSEEYYVLDATHPEAFEYLRRVFHTWRVDWGCEYFKTDFMYFGSDHGPDRAVWYTPGLTRIEIWRRVAEMIRQEIGEALWLGCGCPLWASIGMVDAIRIGGDVGVSWSGDLSAQSLLRDLPTRNFANQILWQIDPDCILLRECYHYLSEAEVQALAIFAGMGAGVRITSDDLSALSSQRMGLWQLLLGQAPAVCRFPLLGQSPMVYERIPAGGYSQRPRHLARPADPVLVQVQSPAGLNFAHPDWGQPQAAVFILNAGEFPVQRTYPLAELGLPAPARLHDWNAGEDLPEPVERLSVRLNRHEGALFFLFPVHTVSP